MNIQYTLLILPYFIFPVWGGMAVGLYSQLNVSGIVQLLILMTSITIVTTSTIWLFYYRAQVVLPENHRLKHGTKGMFIFMVTLLVGNMAAGLHLCFLFVQGPSEDAMKEEYYRVRGETNEKNGPVCELRIISAVFESHSSRAVSFPYSVKPFPAFHNIFRSLPAKWTSSTILESV